MAAQAAVFPGFAQGDSCLARERLHTRVALPFGRPMACNNLPGRSVRASILRNPVAGPHDDFCLTDRSANALGGRR